MIVKKLKDEQVQLILQRSQAKDVIEGIERRLGQIVFAIQTLEPTPEQPQEDEKE